MEEVDNILNTAKIKPELNISSITRHDLKAYLTLRYGSLNACANVSGMTLGRLSQMLSGYKTPKSPKIIQRLSNLWGINIVLLTQFFEREAKDVSPIY